MQNKNNSIFLPDDYEKVYNKYFKNLLNSDEYKFDLSYWYNSIFPGHNIIKVHNINKYKSDYESGLKGDKEILIDCINKWDMESYNYNETTICSSITTASLIVLLYLQFQGISKIFFETPAYFASIEQAKSLKISYSLMPTYFDNEYQLENTSFSAIYRTKSKKALWLTQPRFALGINQNKRSLDKILNSLNDDDYLIIDEATEQLHPAYLKDYNFRRFKNIIKLRSFLKGIGLNGPRIAYILHHETFRKKMENYLELTQGAIDCFSLNFAVTNLRNSSFFKKLLFASNYYVNELRKKIQLITRGTCLYPSQLINGYIGSIAIKLKQDNSYLKEREELLTFCKKNKILVILGASMIFAFDYKFEYVRVNYFNPEYTVLKSVEILSELNDR